MQLTVELSHTHPTEGTGSLGVRADVSNKRAQVLAALFFGSAVFEGVANVMCGFVQLQLDFFDDASQLVWRSTPRERFGLRRGLGYGVFLRDNAVERKSERMKPSIRERTGRFSCVVSPTRRTLEKLNAGR